MRFKMMYLWLCLPFLIVAIWLVAFYMPLSSFIEKQQKNLVQVRNIRETMEGSIRNMLEFRQKDVQTRSSLDGISKSMPLYYQFPSAIKAITESGKKEGVVFEALNSITLPNDPQQSPSLLKPALDIGVKGRFLNIGKFLEAVEKQKGYKRFAEGKISYTEKDYPVLTGKFLIEFRAWKGDYIH